MPPPPADVADWPLIGSSVYELWGQASRSLESLVVKFSPQLRDAATWLVRATVGTGVAIAQSLLSILIAAAMLVGASGAATTATTVSKRLVGPSGGRFIQMTTQTIR